MTTALMFETLQLPVFTADVWAGNTIDPDGVEWWVTKEEGWASTPDMRLDLTNRPRRDGAFDAPGFRAPRVITLEGIAIAPSWEAKELAKNRLAAAFADTSALAPFQVREQLFSRQVMARLSAPAKIVDRTRTTFEWTLQVTAPDPVRLSSDAHQATCGLPQPSSGLTFPLTFPLRFGDPVGGSLVATNRGSTPALPHWQIYGPCDTPTITHLTSGARLAFQINLGAGDVLDVDVSARTVFLGTASRRWTLLPSSTWFGLAPGDNPIGFASPSPNVSASLTAYWRDAWI